MDRPGGHRVSRPIVALDFETANERRDSACAVGLAWIEGGAVVRRESQLIRPRDLRFSPGNIRVHGILPADVRNQPEFPEAMAAFLPDLAEGLILAHNAPFDLGVLRASLATYGMRIPALASLCTLQLARQVFPDPAGCGLGKVAGRLGIRFEHHDAEEDAYACAEIALAATRHRGAADIPTLARSIGFSTAPRLVEPDRPMTQPRREAPALRFGMRGRTGNRYEVTLEKRPAGLSLRCTCAAGRYALRCRHVTALCDGDVTDLLTGNHADVVALSRLLAADG